MVSDGVAELIRFTSESSKPTSGLDIIEVDTPSSGVLKNTFIFSVIAKAGEYIKKRKARILAVPENKNLISKILHCLLNLSGLLTILFK